MPLKLLPVVLALALTGEPPGDGRVTVVVASRPLPAGTVVEVGFLARRQVPAKLATKSVVRPEDARYLVGARIVEDFDAGVPLRWSAFASAASTDEVLRCARTTAAGSPPLRLRGITPADGDTVKVLVARKDIEQGSAFDAALFTGASLPTDQVGFHAVRAADVEKLKGQRILVPMLAGDPLHATQLAGRSEPERCRIIFEEMGNRFVLGPPPEEAEVVACPKGAVARSGIPIPRKEPLTRDVGWIRFCEAPAGVRQGSFAAWNRKGFLQMKGGFSKGAPHGRWETLDEKGVVIEAVGFEKGLLHGPYQMGPEGRLAQGEFAANTKRGKWRLRSDDGSLATGLFEDGRFAGVWTFEREGKPMTLTFEGGRPKGGVATGRKVSILVLTRDLKTGEKVGEDDLSTLELPAWARSEHFVEPDSARYFVGLEAPFALRAGSPLSWNDFAMSFRASSLVLEKASAGGAP